ncbi:MAG: glycoside hydrolase family 15 protein [Chloroflexota bacterium]
MAYKRIRDYGVIGDSRSAALVGIDGSIDWCCFPRFDSPSVFAAILDDKEGGRFQIAPTTSYDTHQEYLPNTNVLSTTFETNQGQATLIDFMPLTESSRPGQCPHEIHRVLTCTQGTMTVECLFQPRLDYGRAKTRVNTSRRGAVASGNGYSLALSSPVPLAVRQNEAQARFTLQEGDVRSFVVSYGRTRPSAVAALHSNEKLQRTIRYWESLTERINYHGLWKKEVVRSFLALHLLIYAPTGTIVAAPTTSLPEEIGGERNWDYRYSWLRDTAFALGTLYRLGDMRDARQFMSWIIDDLKATPGRTRILYGIDPQSDLEEVTLDHLEGYRQSRPVRIGNAAADQIQMDVFGEVITSIATYHRYGGYISNEIWGLVSDFAQVVCENWTRPDRGIWEIRGPLQHFVYSKVMCWAALDQAIMLARTLERPAPIEQWQETADTIKKEVLTRGWSERKQSFVQRYGSEALDASNLLIAFVGFLPPDDPRIQSTIKATIEELAQGHFVRRYNTQEVQDGLTGGEGTFTMLTFWLIGNLLFSGQVRKAFDLFQEFLELANHLGLFSEMMDPSTGEFLGNFPQAFSHLGLIHTARNLNQALRRESDLADIMLP